MLRSRNYTAADSGKDAFDAFMCTTSGNVVVVYENLDGTESTNTLTSVPANVWLFCEGAKRINSTSTTATGLIVA